MKKAVITILGTISCFDKKTKTFTQNKKAEYIADEKLKDLINLKNETYTNMLPILIENFYKDYKIIPIYTELSKDIQKAVLKECEKLKNNEEIIDNVFKNGIFLKDETDFKTILEKIDKKIKKYNEVIIDVSHGFRHLPILMTIDLIINSLKENNKIKNILFAEEIEPLKKYKIIDLTEYLELANLAFILSLFKENYSISNHINIKNKEYKKVVELMREFSINLIGLSIEHLLKKITPSLKKELQKLLTKNEIFFKDEIIKILEILNKTYTFKTYPHRYQSYYYIAEDVASDEKGYLAVAVSLIFEGVSFYLYTNLRDYSPKTKEFFKKLKKRTKSEKNFTDYDILNLCRGVFNFPEETFEETFKVDFKIKKDFNDEIKKELYKAKNKLLKSYNYKGKIKNHPLIKLIKEARILRNNLLHANSGGHIEDVKEKVKNLLEKYNKLIISRS
jgi:CRISPR-associated DxTHG motif protein